MKRPARVTLLGALLAVGLAGAMLHPAFGAATTLAFMHDTEGAWARFTGDVPIGTCAVFWANSRTANDALKITGGPHRFGGCLHSNRDIHIGGNGNTFNRTLRYAASYYNNSNGHVMKAGVVRVAADEYPFPYHLAEYAPTGCKAREAAAQGQYFSFIDANLQLKGAALRDGLYFVQGSATVTLDGFAGRVTVVTTQGVKVSSDVAGARSYMDNLLFFADGTGPNTLSFVGNGGRVSGSMYAPNGALSYSGQSNHYTGQVMADTITVSGGDTSFVALAPVGTRHC